MRELKNKSDYYARLLSDSKGEEVRQKYQLQFHPFKSPPDLSLAEMHRQARFVGRERSLCNYCPCCKQPSNKEFLSLDSELEALFFIGSAYPMYFSFLKTAAIIITMVFIFGGSFNFIMNNLDCETEKCVKFFGLVIMVLENNDPYKRKMTICFISIWIIVLVVFLKKKMFQYLHSIQKTHFEPSSYSLIVKNFPKTATQEEILKYFETKLEVKVTSIDLAYSITDYCQISQKLVIHPYYHQLKTQRIREIKQKEIKLKNEDLDLQIETQLRTLVQQQDQEKSVLENKLLELENEYLLKLNCKFTGTVIISLKSQQEVKKILERYGKSFCRSLKILFFPFLRQSYLKFNSNYLFIQPASNPNEVIWCNMEVNQFWKLINDILMLFISCFIIIGSLLLQELIVTSFDPFEVLIIFGNDGENISTEDLKLNGLYYFLRACLLSFVILATNYFLSVLIKFLIQKQRFDNLSQINKAYINRCFLIQFASVAFIPFIIHSRQNQTLEIKKLLVWDINLIIFIFSIFTPIMRVLNLKNLIKYLKQSHIYRSTEQNCPYTQHELHKLIEPPSMDIANNFCQCLLSLYLACWYAQCAAYGLLFSLIGFLIVYITDKYLLLKKQSTPDFQTYQIFHFWLNNLEILPIVYIMGAIQFEMNLKVTLNFYDLVSFYSGQSITVAMILLVLVIYAAFFKKEYIEPQQEFSYDEAKIYFCTNYAQRNPVSCFLESRKRQKKDEELNKDHMYISSYQDENFLIFSNPNQSPKNNF